MTTVTEEQFQSYAAEGYNHIPVVKEVLADLETPLSAYLKLADGPYSCLLESVVGGERWGRYSIIGLPSNTIISVAKNLVTIEKNGEKLSETNAEDPFAELENFKQQYKSPKIEGLPRFSGGLVGYFAYDCIEYIEPRLKSDQKADPLATPGILLMVAEEVVVFDNVSRKIQIIVHADPENENAYQDATDKTEKIAVKLLAPIPERETIQPIKVDESDFDFHFDKQNYFKAVEKIKDYIIEGDVMQVVLSQRMSIPFSADPFNLYRALRSSNPSPYMYYLNLKDFHVVGASPEVLVRLEDDEVTVRPIAGTRPRGKDQAEDIALEKDLLADPKELAEHLMLIDLGRNDVGRIAETGSVKVTEKMVIERYSHVMHIVSNVIGKLDKDRTALDVLKATFPAGTLSGAPKIRAMEIIAELEPIKRGVYGGAVGYLSWDNNMDTAIAIRTAVIKDDTLYIQAGGGIVHDSIPENEWQESLNKGRAIFRAVSMAMKGIQ
ncbi:MAG: anthranilate synthase component I [Gammaproteobacteria bacterium]|nr:anthranilate synthase component I [Gammaproteobacteria bacterium]